MVKFITSHLTFRFTSVLIVALVITICLGEICPDHKKSCRKGQTCCDDKQGGFDCCPYENATCCSDGRHCCPEDTLCDLAAGRCRRRQSLKQKLLIPSSSLGEYKLKNGNELGSGNPISTNTTLTSDTQVCPDTKQSCPSSYTCCPDPNHGYSCCPYTNAACCSDKIHCCPQGSTCGSGRCM